MGVGRARITPENKEKAKQEKLCLFEILVDARFADRDSADKTWLQGLKHLSLAGHCTAEDAHKIVDAIWGRNKKTENVNQAPDPLDASPSILCKLGSIAIHAEEFFSAGGHDFDQQAILSGLQDEQLREWFKQMNALALLPVKRT